MHEDGFVQPADSREDEPHEDTPYCLFHCYDDLIHQGTLEVENDDVIIHDDTFLRTRKYDAWCIWYWGRQICDQDGHYVNDPVLEQYFKSLKPEDD